MSKKIKLGLIGYPLSHSYSKIIHECAIKTLGYEGSYDILETKPEDLIDRIKYLKINNYDGFNVTIPHKVPISLFLDKVDDLTDCIGSSNTIKIQDDKSFWGYNTDIFGFVNAIPKDIQTKLYGKTVAITGAGGAARACVMGLSQLGVKKINFYVRNILNSKETVDFLRKSFKNMEFNLYQNQFLKDLSDCQMLVNCTPLGMINHSMDLTPVNDNIVKTLPADGIVYDIVYNPMKTNLIKSAIKHGKTPIYGLDMLIYQAQKAFEIWTGELPDFDKLKIAVLEHLI